MSVHCGTAGCPTKPLIRARAVFSARVRVRVRIRVTATARSVGAPVPFHLALGVSSPTSLPGKMAPATTPVAPCRTTRASATRVQVQPLGAAHARAGRPRLSASSSRLSARALGGRALVGLASPASSSVAAAAARRKLSGASGSSFVCLAVAPNQSSSGSSLRPSDDDELGEVLVEVRDVCKSFGSKHVLAGASFQIRRGDRVAIVGPSGTGKVRVQHASHQPACLCVVLT